MGDVGTTIINERKRGDICLLHFVEDLPVNAITIDY
jgi:hypothetical protein